MGCVVQAGIGQAPLRQAALSGSATRSFGADRKHGLRSDCVAVALAAQSIALGDMILCVREGLNRVEYVLRHAGCA